MNEFDEKALTWDDNILNIERAKAIADKIKDQVPLNKDMRGFEYGCGTGLLSLNLISALKSITMADSSDGMLQVLRKKIQLQNITNMDVVNMDLVTDENVSEKFDIIFTAMTIHHIEDVPSILSNFYHMLSPNGFLCIADLDKEDGSFHGPEFKGHLGFDRAYLKKLYETTGFENVITESCYAMKRTNDIGETSEYPLFLITGKRGK
ncbi:MAG: methyltransferase domain-containing protein [Bacteroidota bacterium]